MIIKSIYIKFKELLLKIRLLTVGDYFLSKIEKDYPNVMTTEEVIRCIVEEGYSISRYGDGEFTLLKSSRRNIPFQKGSKDLQQKLALILKDYNNQNKLLVCIPPFNSQFNNTKYFCGKYSFWETYWFENYSKLKSYFKSDKYGNAFISRVDIFNENKLSEIKKIWDKKSVVFVYGKEGRFDVNCSLFDNINEKSILEVESMNAFEQYEFILEQCCKRDKNSLFLLAIGPTATILSYDLSRLGYQALDIGHLPNSFEQYLGNIKNPESLAIKKEESKWN